MQKIERSVHDIKLTFSKMAILATLPHKSVYTDNVDQFLRDRFIFEIMERFKTVAITSLFLSIFFYFTILAIGIKIELWWIISIETCYSVWILIAIFQERLAEKQKFKTSWGYLFFWIVVSPTALIVASLAYAIDLQNPSAQTVYISTLAVYLVAGSVYWLNGAFTFGLLWSSSIVIVFELLFSNLFDEALHWKILAPGLVLLSLL